MIPSNFLKKSLNSLFIDLGVCVFVYDSFKQIRIVFGHFADKPYENKVRMENGRDLGRQAHPRGITKAMRMKNKEFNVTQGMALLLLKPLNLPANYVLNLIIYITNPSNNIGY